MPLWDDTPLWDNTPRRKRREQYGPMTFHPDPMNISFPQNEPLEPFAPPPAFAPIEPPPDEPGFLSTVGDILDRPGNALRGLATGRLEPLLGLIPFSETLGLYDPKKNRVSGQDVNETWLGIDKTDNLLSGSGAAGLATELILDPLNVLPGFMGLKASTKAGVATGKVAGHLDEAARLAQQFTAGESKYNSWLKGAQEAGDVVTAPALADAKARFIKPAPAYGPLGNLLDDAGNVVPQNELIQRMAGQQNELGGAARETLGNQAARGLTDEQAFKAAGEAGERVKAGQEAFLQVGGEFDPLSLFRLGGKYNPVNYLPEVKGLTAPLQLPQKTILEAPQAAQAVQDLWRRAGQLPGIKQVGNLFHEFPALPESVRRPILELAKTSRTKMAAGIEQAAEDVGKFNEELKGSTYNPAGLDELQARAADLEAQEKAMRAGMPPVRDPNTGDLIDPATGEILEEANPLFSETPPAGPNPAGAGPQNVGAPVSPNPPAVSGNFTDFPKLTTEQEARLVAENDGPPSTFQNTIMPEFTGMDRPETLLGSRITPLQDVNARPVYENFDMPNAGHRVRFNRAHAIRRPTDATQALSPRQSGTIDHLFMFDGQTVAQIGEWTVPVDAVKRLKQDVKADFTTALDAFEQERVYTGLTKPEKARLNQRAEDARRAFVNAQDMPSHPDQFGINTEIKDRRGKFLSAIGFKETGIKEQAEALPKFLEAALNKGQVPELKTIEYLSAESGAVGVGDKLKIAGDEFTLKEITADGRAKLKDGIPIEVPMEFIPKDKGSQIQRADMIDPAKIEFPKDELSGKTGQLPGMQKLNKATDVLADIEQRLGLKPVDMERGADVAAPVVKESLTTPPAIMEPLTAGPLVDPVADMNASIEQWRTQRPTLESMVTEVPNEPKYWDPIKEMRGQGSGASAGTAAGILPTPKITAETAKVTPATAKAAPAADSVENLQRRFNEVDLRIKRTDAASVTDNDRNTHRQLSSLIDVKHARAKIAATIERMGAETSAAATGAAKLIPDGSAPDFARAVTDYIEHGGADAPTNVIQTAETIRGKYDEMLKLEQGRGLNSAAMKSERIAYTTHVGTNEGRRFFGSLSDEQRGSLFKRLEDKRIRAGMEPNPEALKTSGRQKLDASMNAPRRKAKPVPKGMEVEANRAMMKLKAEDRAFIQQNGLVAEYLDFAKEISTVHASQIPRLEAYKHLGVSELNEAFTEFGAKGAVFNENPAAQVFTREKRHIQAMAGADFFDGAVNQFGRETDRTGVSLGNGLVDYKDGSVGLESINTQRAAQGLPPIAFDDPATAQAILDTSKRLTDPDEVNELVGWFDNITRAYKGSITRAFPAYHVRNTVSNRLQSWLGGVPLSGAHRETALKALSGKNLNVTLGDGTSLNREALLKEFAESGAGRNGQFEELLKDTVDPSNAEKTWNPFLQNSHWQDNFLIRGGDKVGATLAGGPGMLLEGGAAAAGKLDGRMIEDGDRLAHYIHKRMEGNSPQVAAADVDKHLFDYSKESLTPFEQKYMNRAVLFYGYTRRAVPAMIAAAFTQAGKVKQLTQLGMQPGGPEREPGYTKDALSIPLGTDADGNAMLGYDLGTPIEGAAAPFGKGLPGLLGSLNPALKVPLELGSGQDFFLHKPIEENRKAPHWAADLPGPVRDALGVVEIPTQSGKPKFEMDPLALYALNNSPLSRLSNTLGKATDDRKGAFARGINLFSGAKAVSVDEEAEDKWATKGEIKRRLKELERQGKVRTPEIFTADVAGKEDAEVQALLKALRKG